MNDDKEFDVKTVELKGSNLIEASAGTGKTYSIAILVLRMLLEKQIPIQEILMVTFTNAAVAELEDRIRLFVREAKRCADGQEIEDGLIEEIVKKSIEDKGQEAVARLLKLAVLNLDETSVMTIHGFCQQTLNEFAFETGQLFGAELLQNSSSILEEEIQKFWRTHVTTIQKDLLAYLTEQNMGLEPLSGYVQSHLSGKTYLFYDENEVYDFEDKMQSEAYEKIQILDEKYRQKAEEVNQYLAQNIDQLEEIASNNRYAKTWNCKGDPICFLKKVEEKFDSKYIGEIFSDLKDLILERNGLNEEKNLTIGQVLNQLYSFGIQEVTQKIKEHKINRALLSYDDLIGNLHHALVGRENPDLEEKLRKKYQAVFIDEFQDTDRLQYEIFEKAFATHALLFYIGDPKQSIYAFRTADIFTYFKARSSVDSVYGMNVNYRSNAQLIEAMNHFFLPSSDFDTFNFETSTEQIDYISVQSPVNNGKGILKYAGKPVSGIGVNNSSSSKPKALYQAAFQVHALLTDENYQIFDKAHPEGRSVRPSDIGILVKAKKSGQKIKGLLDQKGIPAITVDESKILQSAEAKAILGVLEAMVSPKRATINLVLLSGFLNWPKEEVLRADEEILVEKFKTYYEKWVDKGIYTALLAWMEDFNIRQNLLGNYAASGERTLTNLYHLIEVLYKTGNRQRLNPEELTDWLKVKINVDDSEEDEMQQRIENDEEAVRIVTIHSSKGLEYNLVIAPELDFKLYEDKDRIQTFRDEKGDYRAATLNEMSESDEKLFRLQYEQENRRLLYVAVTRAVMNCFIFSTTTSGTTMSVFKNAIDYDGEFISKIEELEESDLLYQAEEEKQSQELVADDFQLKSNYWMRTSYSALAAQLEHIIKPNYEEEGEIYDEFIFKTLRKGAKTGNFLHYLFENLNFQREESWEFVLDKALMRFYPNQDEQFKENMLVFLNQVLKTSLTATESFSMADVALHQTLHELEFDFPLPLFPVHRLNELMGDKIQISDRFPQRIEGMMNGKIDLFFQHDGKYFVLDWKSNYLGPNLEDYSPENLDGAMTEANYHLQYMIYCLAVKKYLFSRLGRNFDWDRDFGGVFYLFVRGMRTGTDFGIFHREVKLEELLQWEKVMNRFAK